MKSAVPGGNPQRSRSELRGTFTLLTMQNSFCPVRAMRHEPESVMIHGRECFESVHWALRLQERP